MEIANLIDGKLRPPRTGRFLDNVEPATGVVYGRTPDSGPDDVDDAVAAAARAFPGWAATPAAQRSRLLLALADLIEQNLEALARAESIDTGKPISLARAVDIPRAAANLRFFATAILHTAAAAHHMSPGGVQGAGAAGALNYTLRSPRGVAGCISPWNLPLYLFTWKIAPALATGNTVVGKPSEVTPATAHLLAELSIEAGFPPGVLNIVHGRGDVAGSALVQHPRVPTLSFTGSTRVGAWISATAGPMFKRLGLELGGKNATIIFDDADPATAIPTAARGAFANQAQSCN
jgi:aminomuconate-semialdehyde/2-hydroxymuconate-6-semialdehyde dehydrogenase